MYWLYLKFFNNVDVLFTWEYMNSAWNFKWEWMYDAWKSHFFYEKVWTNEYIYILHKWMYVRMYENIFLIDLKNKICNACEENI